jgi:hypothetical protein
MLHRTRVVLAFFLAVPAVLLADDVVRVKGSTIGYRGEIVRWDDRGLVMKTGPSQQLKEFTRDQIDRVDTKWPQGFDAGKAALTKGDFNEAVLQLRSALRDEQRNWAKDMIKGYLLQGVDGQGDLDATAELFVEIAPGRRDAGVMAYAPLRWTNDAPVSEQQRTAARSWLMKQDDPVVKLLAANWLIDGPDRDRAATVIERLVTDPDSRVRPVARAMLMREQLRKNPEAVTKEDVADYKTEVSQLPNSVRLGPQFVLGMAHDAVGEPIDAALAYLYIPFVISGPADLQAEALERAAAACRKAKLNQDAAKIAAELQNSFPTSAAAKRLKQPKGR